MRSTLGLVAVFALVLASGAIPPTPQRLPYLLGEVHSSLKLELARLTGHVHSAATDCRSPAGWAEIGRPAAIPIRSSSDLEAAPSLERVNSVAPSALATGRLYVGGSSGLFVSDDCGASWRSISRPRGRVSHMSVRSDGQDRLYAFNGQDQFLVSVNGGRSWEEPEGITPDGKRHHRLLANADAVSPGPSGTAYATSFPDSEGRGPYPIAQWLSGDGGRTWTPVGALRYGSSYDRIRFARRIAAIHPRDPATLYSIGRDEGARRSRDDGQTFEPFIREFRPSLSSDDQVRQIRISRDGSRFWLLTIMGQLYVSTDDGVTWDKLTDVPPHGRLVSIETNPHDPSSVFGITESSPDAVSGHLWLYREGGATPP